MLNALVSAHRMMGITQGLKLSRGNLTWLLQAANISKERLASFDRPIRSEPEFTQQQCAGLKKDLTAYLQTLKASRCPHNSALTDMAPHSMPIMTLAHSEVQQAL